MLSQSQEPVQHGCREFRCPLLRAYLRHRNTGLEGVVGYYPVPEPPAVHHYHHPVPGRVLHGQPHPVYLHTVQYLAEVSQGRGVPSRPPVKEVALPVYCREVAPYAYLPPFRLLPEVVFARFRAFSLSGWACS